MIIGFQSRNSQAIKIPKELKVKTDEVFNKEVKNELLIKNWENWWNSFDAIEDLKREQGSQKREEDRTKLELKIKEVSS